MRGEALGAHDDAFTRVESDIRAGQVAQAEGGDEDEPIGTSHNETNAEAGNDADETDDAGNDANGIDDVGNDAGEGDDARNSADD